MSCRGAAWALDGSLSTPTRFAEGTIRFKRSIRLPSSSVARMLSPVTLPPGFAMLLRLCHVANESGGHNVVNNGNNGNHLCRLLCSAHRRIARCDDDSCDDDSCFFP